MRKVLYTLLTLVGVLVLAVVGAGFYVVSSLNLGEDERATPVPSFSSIRNIETGEVVGFVDGHDAHAWMGIPYAAAPVGDLRWRAPQPAIPHQGRFEALTPIAQCPQFAGELVGKEDCLGLNIWTPIIAAELVPSGDDLMPVMFWIHGGGNSIGNGASDMYNGSLMASEHKVAVVSINYRLGPLGWFSHPALRGTARNPEDASGNYGTLDIIHALKWVQANIEAFGGDPNNVTIYGESAGGVDVLTMMASPLAKGLFHRAIVQSGGYSPESIEVAENYADEGGHRLSSREVVTKLLLADGTAANAESAREQQESMSEEALASYLRSKPPAEFFAAYRGSGGSLSMLGNPDVFADTHVLPDVPATELFSDPANYNAVPLIIGTNRDEVKLFQFLGGEQVKRFMGVPYSLVDEVAYERTNRYGSDMWKARSVEAISMAITGSGAPPVFAYRFDVDDLRDLGIVDFKQLLGAAHALEIPFVFGNFGGAFDFIHPPSWRDQRDLLSGAMMSYWAEFAYTGDPGTGRLNEQPQWTSWRSEPDADRILIFDYESDQGIVMSDLLITADDVRQRFLGDTSFETDEAFCAAYESTFNEPADVERCL